MKYSVLGLGYAPNEYDVERTEWMKHGIVFDFAESIDEAADKLRKQNYVCIAIRSDHITPGEIASLREVRPISTVILPPAYSASEAHICAHLSAIQYVRATPAELQVTISVKRTGNIITGIGKWRYLLTMKKSLPFALMIQKLLRLQ